MSASKLVKRYNTLCTVPPSCRLTAVHTAGFVLSGKNSKTELAKLIVAQDLFGLWGDDLTMACTAALIGAQKWAGDDVAPVSLLVYLRDSVPAVQPLMVRPGKPVIQCACYLELYFQSISQDITRYRCAW